MTTTPNTARATGRSEVRDETAHVVFERTFKAPMADLWAAVTESDRLTRWIGNWSGDLARIDFDDYYPHFAGHHRSGLPWPLLGDGTRRPPLQGRSAPPWSDRRSRGTAGVVVEVIDESHAVKPPRFSYGRQAGRPNREYAARRGVLGGMCYLLL